MSKENRKRIKKDFVNRCDNLVEFCLLLKISVTKDYFTTENLEILTEIMDYASKDFETYLCQITKQTTTSSESSDSV